MFYIALFTYRSHRALQCIYFKHTNKEHNLNNTLRNHINVKTLLELKIMIFLSIIHTQIPAHPAILLLAPQTHTHTHTHTHRQSTHIHTHIHKHTRTNTHIPTNTQIQKNLLPTLILSKTILLDTHSHTITQHTHCTTWEVLKDPH